MDWKSIFLRIGAAALTELLRGLLPTAPKVPPANGEVDSGAKTP